MHPPDAMQLLNALHDGSWDVMIDDIFRIGKHTTGRTRPIIVKLHSLWDRRAAVSGSFKVSSLLPQPDLN